MVISTSNIKLAVIGLGYVGLPLAVEFESVNRFSLPRHSYSKAMRTSFVTKCTPMICLEKAR